MEKEIARTRKGLEGLRQNGEEILQELATLQHLLTNLRFEGKICLSKNLRLSLRSLEEIREKLEPLIEVEERTLFPFIEVHIPRLQSVLCVLEGEHENLRQSIRNLRALLKGSLGKKNVRTNGHLRDICEAGIYLVYFLKQHFEAEESSIHRAARRELRRGEKKSLGRLIQHSHRLTKQQKVKNNRKKEEKK